MATRLRIAASEAHLARMHEDLEDPRRSLTADQRGVVFIIGQGRAPDEAASYLRVHPERVRRWLLTPRFRRAIYLEQQHPMTPEQLSGSWAEEG